MSKMCINEMTVILKSLDVASASERVAELFCKNIFGDSAVGIGFERGIAADDATGWMNGNVGQQSLHASEQRVSSAGGQPSVATKDAAAQEGPDEAMRQALAASSAKEASAVINAKGVLAASSTMTPPLRATRTWSERTRWVERPMLLIGSPMCCIIISSRRMSWKDTQDVPED